MPNFQFDFTLDKFKQLVPNNPKVEEWFESVNLNLPDYQIDTKLRVAAWIAQIGHESGSFKLVVENLNYSADRLLQVFPYYFNSYDQAAQYAHNPEKIANRVYGSRMGNGNEASGDGYRFRGRGLIQLTGRENYTNCSQTMYGDLILLDQPDLLTETDGAVRSACWFWNSRNLNSYADGQDMREITRRINGGYNGMDDRMARYNKAMAVL